MISDKKIKYLFYFINSASIIRLAYEKSTIKLLFLPFLGITLIFEYFFALFDRTFVLVFQIYPKIFNHSKNYTSKIKTMRLTIFFISIYWAYSQLSSLLIAVDWSVKFVDWKTILAFEEPCLLKLSCSIMWLYGILTKIYCLLMNFLVKKPFSSINLIFRHLPKALLSWLSYSSLTKAIYLYFVYIKNLLFSFFIQTQNFLHFFPGYFLILLFLYIFDCSLIIATWCPLQTLLAYWCILIWIFFWYFSRKLLLFSSDVIEFRCRIRNIRYCDDNILLYFLFSILLDSL